MLKYYNIGKWKSAKYERGNHQPVVTIIGRLVQHL